MLLLFSFLACSQSEIVDDSPSEVTQKEFKSEKASEKEVQKKNNVPNVVPTFSGNAHAATANIPNLLQGISKKGCDNGPGGAGAVSYFYDELSIKDGVVSGSERWLMYAKKNGRKRKVVTVKLFGL